MIKNDKDEIKTGSDKNETKTVQTFTKKDLTLQCLLNIFDGIFSSNNRILFITTNNIDMLNQFEALMRPGRVDKQILVDYCDIYQVKKMFQHFYPHFKFPPTFTRSKSMQLRNNITIADFMSRVLTTSPEEMLKYCYE